MIPKQNSRVVDKPVLTNAAEHDCHVKIVADSGGVTKPANQMRQHLHRVQWVV